MYNTVFLDAGHGGITPKGEYTTAPSKMFKHHESFDSNNPSGDFTFYEGVKNRIYHDSLAMVLARMGINVVKVYHPYEDTSLKARVDLANIYHSTISKGIYISEHSNAVSGDRKASGLCVFTTPGNTESDVLASMFMDLYKKNVGYKVLEDKSDGDSDFEANFYVIKNTIMPAILVENLFFDNIVDAKSLYNKEYMQKYLANMAEFIVKSLQYLNSK